MEDMTLQEEWLSTILAKSTRQSYTMSKNTSKNNYEDRPYHFINKHRSIVDSAHSCHGSHCLNLEAR